MYDTNLLDDLLLLSCDELQLSPTKHGAAEGHYHAVADWLGADNSPLAALRPLIYPQGSFLTGTTTKPIYQAEYDLDLVCEMLLHSRVTALEAWELVRDRLLANATYAPMVRPLKRCVRLVYAGDFHLDILPAAPQEPRVGTRIRVPDRKVEDWKPSDPKGFGGWFKKQGALYLLEKRADVEPVPRLQSVEEKTPLQRGVQLAKRARDIFFGTDVDSAPRSIVLTTLAGHAYRGQISTAATLNDLIVDLCAQAALAPTPLVVRNPVHPDEILSEQWIANPNTFVAYRRWLDWFATCWSQVMAANSIPAAQKALSALFGDAIITDVLRKHAAHTNDMRKAQALKVTQAGALTSGLGAAVVLPNTFYGKR